MVDILDAKKELGKLPDIDELNRLVEYYPTYEWEHRANLLYGYFQGKSVEEMVDDKLTAKNIDKSSCKYQCIGAHTKWVKFKVKRAIIRILYVRYRLDENMTKRVANQQILKKYFSKKNAKDGGQSSIRYHTRTPKFK